MFSPFQILFFTALAVTYGEPDPKKFKNDMKERDSKSNGTLTEDEKTFLREVEAKFGFKTELHNDKVDPKTNINQGLTTPFPAVIAIEIVNDTETTSKGKRTIDANLGYGYKTNKGYSYSYFGKAAQEKGKFMIYPYSQEDIPSTSNHASSYDNLAGRYKTVTTNVEIQPSRAFELVTVNDDTNSYPMKKPEYGNNYSDNIKGINSPPPAYPPKEYTANTQTQHQSTLYTTYNGQGISGLSNHFPMVMSNYFVNPSQLVNQPEYQSAGLTRDHLHSLQGSKVAQSVVPVLVLRIPSSSLKNPTAELFANLPENYPLSRYLNNVNLQALVNQYFKKFGYPSAPQITTNQDSPNNSEQSSSTSVLNNEPQNYAVPYVQPSYTHADFSGVQYSAVKPVMARYPSSYTRQRYYPSQGHSLYHQPLHQQKYDYQYQHVSDSPVLPHTYYVQPQYRPQIHQAMTQQVDAHHSPQEETSLQDTSDELSSQVNHENTVTRTLEFRHPQVHIDANHETNTALPEYGVPKESAEYERSSAPVYEESSEETKSQEYDTSPQKEQKEESSVYPSQREQDIQQYYSQSDLSETQGYTYQQQYNDHTSNDVLDPENYSTSDNTVATVLPLSYKSQISQPSNGAVQTVSYVTPMPYSYKYQSPYKMMVPRTYLKNPVTEKVAYVNSQSMSMSHLQSGQHYENNPEEEYTVSSHYIPPISKQKPPYYPRNYHSLPKRMVRPESSTPSFSRQHTAKNEKKSSS